MVRRGFRSALGLAVVTLMAGSGCGLTLDADPPDPQARTDAAMDGGVTDGGGTDGGPADGAWADGDSSDAASDAGPACFANEECDDGDPCTTEVCSSSGRCTRRHNTAACDDGVYCNGPDRCVDGSCDDHLGDPCLAGTVCDEEADACVGCVSDADCPTVPPGPWTTCDYSGPCDREATRTREVTTYSCAGGECMGTTGTETEPCARSTEGDKCGARTDCTYGDCTYADECAESGEQAGTCTVPVCVDGACDGTDTRTRTRLCTRDTELQQCGAEDVNPCDGVDVCMSGSCTFEEDPCATDFACVDATCECAANADCDVACATMECDGTGCGCVLDMTGTGQCGCLP